MNVLPECIRRLIYKPVPKMEGYPHVVIDFDTLNHCLRKLNLHTFQEGKFFCCPKNEQEAEADFGRLGELFQGWVKKYTLDKKNTEDTKLLIALCRLSGKGFEEINQWLACKTPAEKLALSENPKVKRILGFFGKALDDEHIAAQAITTEGTDMKLNNTREYYYFARMLSWEEKAPLDGKHGNLDGEPAINSQIERLAFILNIIAAGDIHRTFSTLSVYCRRREGDSYISKDISWMRLPKELLGGWHFEGNISLKQKQDLVQCLTKLGISPGLVACIDDFIAGLSIKNLHPSDDELLNMLSRMHDSKDIDDDDYNDLVASIKEKISS